MGLFAGAPGGHRVTLYRRVNLATPTSMVIIYWKTLDLLPHKLLA
jgi:hypothetical protein